MYTTAIRTLALLAPLFITACTGFATEDDPAQRGPLGKADLVGSCVDSGCDGQSPSGNCWCDEACAEYGDCCEDEAAVCDGAEPEPTCVVSGCSGQICDSEPRISTCEFLPWYGCFADATCEVQASGACGWTYDDDLLACFGDNGGPAPSCEALGGECLSSPIDVTFGANCEADYGRETLSGACLAINQTCCGGPATGCDAQEAAGVGLCAAIVGVVWNGSDCHGISGCSCEGPDCADIYDSLEACEAAHAHCE